MIWLIAPTNNSWSSKLSSEKSAWNKSGYMDEAFNNCENVALNNLTRYDYSLYKLSTTPRNMTVASSSGLYTLKSYNDVFPIEYIKKIDDTHIYVVYKLIRSDEQTVYVYTVFEKSLEQFDITDGVEEKGEYEMWTSASEFYFCTKSLEYCDFSELKIGDTFQKANDIDYAISFDANFVSSNSEKSIFTAYRLLKDGLLIIEFESITNELDGSAKPPEMSEYMVSKMNFYKYGANETAVSGVSILNQGETIQLP